MKIKFRFVVLLLASFLLSACGEDLTDVEYVQRAKDFLDQSDLSAAVIDLKSALSQNPDNPEARLILGKIYLQIEEGALAAKEFSKAIALGISDAETKLLLTESLLIQGEFEEVLNKKGAVVPGNDTQKAVLAAFLGNAAVALDKNALAETELKESLELAPLNRYGMLGQAKLMLRKSNTEGAVGILEQLLADEADWGRAWSLKADIHAVTGDSENAVKAYARAIENRVNNTSDHLKRSLVHIGAGQYDLAQKDIDEVYRRVSKHPGAIYAEGMIHFNQENFVEAQTAFEKLLAVAPDYWPGVFYLGATHYFLGHGEQALSYLNRYHTAHPEEAAAAQFIASIEINNKNYQRAEKLLKQIVLQTPDDALSVELLSAVTAILGNPEESVAQMENLANLLPDSSDIHTKVGLSKLLAQETDGSVAALNRARSLNPNAIETDILLFSAYSRQKEFEKALSVARELHEKHPDKPMPLNLLGISHFSLGEREKGVEFFKQALAVQPGYPTAADNLAKFELSQGNVEAAIGYYQQVLENFPGNFGALESLAKIENDRGEIHKARDYLEKALEINPNYIRFYMLLSRYYLLVGEAEKALEFADKGLEVHPDSGDLLKEKGKAEHQLMRNADAIASFRKLAQKRPESADAHYLLSQSYKADSGNSPAMKKALFKAYKIDSKHLNTQIAYARFLLDEEKLGKSQSLAEELLKAHPENADVMELNGDLALRQQDLSLALYHFGNAYNLQKRSALIAKVGEVLWKQGKKDKSISMLRAWYDNNQDDSLVLYWLANAYLSTGSLEEAESAYEKLITMLPENGLVRNNLAWLIRNKNRKEALVIAKQAVELEPDNPAFRDTLAKLEAMAE